MTLREDPVFDTITKYKHHPSNMTAKEKLGDHVPFFTVHCIF